jgi:hypothetical protein
MYGKRNMNEQQKPGLIVCILTRGTLSKETALCLQEHLKALSARRKGLHRG